MSKYRGLSDLLQRQTSTSVEFTFSELDDVVPGGLPASARIYVAWWANEIDGSHSQARAWMLTGWLVDQVNLTTGRVIFRRRDIAPATRKSETPDAAAGNLQDSLGEPGGDAAAVEAFRKVVEVFSQGTFTADVAHLERFFATATLDQAAIEAGHRGFDLELLLAALDVRRHVGRINDLVHAATICVTLARLREPEEVFEVAPSLAAGNDPSRLYDVQTTRRRAEFKVSVWKGADVARKRSAFQDLVHLAAAPRDGRLAQLFVVGPQTAAFFDGSTSSVRWALDRGAESTRQMFAEKAWDIEMSIRSFRAEHARHVEVIDLADELVPELRGVASL